MDRQEKSLTVTWMGTNTILLDTGTTRLLFDPFMELAGGPNPCSLDTFYGETDILITHGHFDHLLFVPSIIEHADATVYCSKTPAAVLARYTPAGEDEEHLFDSSDNCTVVVRPGMKFRIGDAQIRVLQGRHIRFDLRIVLHAFNPLRVCRYMRNFLFLMRYAPAFRENGETLCYEIEARGKRVLLLGSLGLDPHTRYPEGADLLIMPYQGRRHMEKLADRVIGTLRPARIMLSHFDDAYPPFSENVSTRKLAAMMRRRYPGVQVIKPRAGKRIRI